MSKGHLCSAAAVESSRVEWRVVCAQGWVGYSAMLSLADEALY
jgi:hypothetical protein